LPQAYAAADAFVLGSLFETFGIVYIEAMAMGLPVFCTSHPNQRDIVKEAVFVDMARAGALTASLRDTPRDVLAALGRRGREIVRQHYDLELLKRRYVEQYQVIAQAPSSLPQYNVGFKLRANLRNALRRTVRSVRYR
jgi:glycosyltransferase involved in cell wall biosynthesis